MTLMPLGSLLLCSVQLEKFDYIPTANIPSPCQRRIAILIPYVHVRTLCYKKFNHIQMTLVRSPHQRRPPFLVLRV